VKVTLRKALRIKNKLAGEIARLQEIIKNNNSQIKGRNYSYDSNQVLGNELLPVFENLIEVKSKIAKANVAIYDKVFRIAELKSMVVFLRGVDTTDGLDTKSNRGYLAQEEKEVWKTATLKDIDIQSLIQEMENQIETLQDEVDAFNAAQEIELGFD
jgi:predicted ribosome quality control (RQC) complex YloA/Tae2 family protein